MNRIPMLKVLLGPDVGDAFQARAAAASRWSLLRVSSTASIAIAAFCTIYFVAEFLR